MPLVPHVSSGQIVASTWGNLVADQVVMRFTTAAQRSSQLTAPILNQLTSTDDRPGVIQRWTGTAWVDLDSTGYAGASPNASIASGANAFVDVPLVMPRAGDLIVQGHVNVNTSGTGGATAIAHLASSTPAPTNGPQGLGNPVSTSVPYLCLALLGRWAGVTAGATVTVRVQVSHAGGTATLIFYQYAFVWRVAA